MADRQAADERKTNDLQRVPDSPDRSWRAAIIIDNAPAGRQAESNGHVADRYSLPLRTFSTRASSSHRHLQDSPLPFSFVLRSAVHRWLPISEGSRLHPRFFPFTFSFSTKDGRSKRPLNRDPPHSVFFEHVASVCIMVKRTRHNGKNIVRSVFLFIMIYSVIIAWIDIRTSTATSKACDFHQKYWNKRNGNLIVKCILRRIIQVSKNIPFYICKISNKNYQLFALTIFQCWITSKDEKLSIIETVTTLRGKIIWYRFKAQDIFIFIALSSFSPKMIFV